MVQLAADWYGTMAIVVDPLANICFVALGSCFPRRYESGMCDAWALTARDGSFGASNDVRCMMFRVGLWHGGLDPDGATILLGISVFSFVVNNYVLLCQFFSDSIACSV
ncbi:hypothetical protein L484_001346 [Morus notabilis]|uniref:Uncharacterized protein n=1 Tax=Morus notabilis TaxID=981085 RepID=W9T2A9_9ROSA|nr:hypothetical protein L484_001346 [Morus notabilis]